jgi:hypothetical protein
MESLSDVEKEVKEILAKAAKKIEEVISLHKTAVSVTNTGMDKLRQERELLEKEKGQFAELTKKFESVHFSKVVTLNIGSLVYSPY